MSQTPSSDSKIRRRRMPSYRIWGSTDDGEVEFESLTTETLEGALDIIRGSFFVNESVCQGVDLLSEPGAAEELVELCRDATKDGVSVVGIEVKTGKVVTVSFNKIQVLSTGAEKSAFEMFAEKCKYKSSKALIEFMINLDTRIDVFKHHNVNVIMEMMFLGTLSTHTKRRFGELVVAASVELARQLKAGKDVKTPVATSGTEEVIVNKNAVPELCSMLCTSEYSYKIAEKIGFDTLLTVPLSEFEFEGKKYTERIVGDHRYCRLVTKRLSGTPKR